jgi:hypothetical protein
MITTTASRKARGTSSLENKNLNSVLCDQPTSVICQTQNVAPRSCKRQQAGEQRRLRHNANAFKIYDFHFTLSDALPSFLFPANLISSYLFISFVHYGA